MEETSKSQENRSRPQLAEIIPIMEAAKEKLRLTLEKQSLSRRGSSTDLTALSQPPPPQLSFADTGNKLRCYSLCSDEYNLELDFEVDAGDLEFAERVRAARQSIDEYYDDSDAYSDASTSSKRTCIFTVCDSLCVLGSWGEFHL